MLGKNINYYLMDGSSSGRIKCTISNWTGVAYRIPRTSLERCKDRDDLKQSGVYFLFGIDEDTGKNLVYIGQAGARKSGEGVLYRLQEHKRNSEKDYWTEAVIFTTQNNSFGPTEISWLENRFCLLATEAQRYVIKNGNDPNMGNVTEEKESELEEFIDYAKIIMGVLGHKVFESISKSVTISTEQNGEEKNNLLYMKRHSKKSNLTTEATCIQTSEGFVVKKGSVIEMINSKRIPVGVKNRRQTAKINNDGVLQEDVLFQSPSYAAAFVIGGHANGYIEWKDAEGNTLQKIEGRQ